MEGSNTSDQTLVCCSCKKIIKLKSKSPQIPVKRAHWTLQEDDLLLSLVTEFGKKWSKIGKAIGGRSGKQVRDRYVYTLNPDINRDQWTKEEDSMLLSLYNNMGNKWRQMATYLPGRTENQIKARLKSKTRKIHPLESIDTSDSLVHSIFSPIVCENDRTEFESGNVAKLENLFFNLRESLCFENKELVSAKIEDEFFVIEQQEKL